MNKRGIKWFFTNYIWNFIQTTIHKFWVLFYLVKFCSKLLWRGLCHDLSKYSNSEALIFSDVIFNLKKTEYGTPEYAKSLERIKPCLEHHYSCNSHHPEYYKNGFEGMSTIDRVELTADWCASVRRNKCGCVAKSIELNQARFKYSDADKAWIKSLALSMTGSLKSSVQPTPLPDSLPVHSISS